MVKLRPCGRYVISVCTNPSCSILGGRRLFERARDALGEDAEGVTDDGLLTLEEEECLAACDGAPVVAVNYVYDDRVTDDGLDVIIEGIRSGSVPEASRGGRARRPPDDLPASCWGAQPSAGSRRSGAGVGVGRVGWLTSSPS